MADCFVGISPRSIISSPRPTQPPTVSDMGNEYQPKRGAALHLEVKAGPAHSIAVDASVGGR